MQTKTTFRLNSDQYAVLEKQALASVALLPKSELEAGAKIGIENTLRLLRNGFVVE